MFPTVVLTGLLLYGLSLMPRLRRPEGPAPRPRPLAMLVTDTGKRRSGK